MTCDEGKIPMTTATETTHIILPPQDRAEILNFASWLLPAAQRQRAETVVSYAGPLLEWAQQAASHDDQRARMAGMRRQHNNETGIPKEPRDPEGFLAQARVHYEFIRGTGE
jgi:hypothetical protein